MSHNQSRLEFLANETLIEIFEYFNAQDLFQAFNNLNLRFNKLLRCLNHLCYITPKPYPNESVDDEMFSPYIYTLISKCNLDYQFCHFTNVHRLILNRFPCHAFKYFDVNNFPHLEHLSVRTPHCLMQCPYDFHQNSLSNGFSRLKSCSYPDGLDARPEIVAGTQSPSLSVLNVGIMNFSVYNIILSSCPNLYSLSFSQWPWDDITHPIQPHIHLKQMIIKLTFDDFLHYTYLNDYLTCVPNLEQLTIHHYLDKSIMSEKSFRRYDWFASMIASYLPVLARFHLYLHLPSHYRAKKFDLIAIRNLIEKSFNQMHNNPYQSRIVIKY